MIIFISSCMKSGGAERVTAHQANYWSEKGRKVGIITYDDVPSHYVLNPDVQVFTNNLAAVSKNKIHAIFNNFNRAFVLRKWFKRLKPVSVITVMEEVNIVTCLASIGLPHRLIVYDVANPAYYNYSGLRRRLKQIIYKIADVLIVQTQGVKSAYDGFSLPIEVVRNPLPPPPKLTIDYNNRVIVSVGRLDAMKNLALIVKAFALVNAPDWEVRIFGAGPEQQNLENLIVQLGVQNRVFLKGLSKNIYSELEKASIFAFGSKMEGYPNALLEGLSAGLATVSSDCPYGPSEIITQGKNGLLVPNNDEKAFAKALQRLIDDVDLRARLGREAAKIADDLSIEKIMKEWEAIVIKK